MGKQFETHSLKIGTSEYFIHGGNTEMLIDIAKTLGLKYDDLQPSKLSSSQRIIKIWGIGELKDHLDKKPIK